MDFMVVHRSKKKQNEKILMAWHCCSFPPFSLFFSEHNFLGKQVLAEAECAHQEVNITFDNTYPPRFSVFQAPRIGTLVSLGVLHPTAVVLLSYLIMM